MKPLLFEEPWIMSGTSMPLWHLLFCCRASLNRLFQVVVLQRLRMHTETQVWPSMWVAVWGRGIFSPLTPSFLWKVHPVLSFSCVLPLTEIIRAERISVRDVSSSAATLQWRPVLSGARGHYEVRFGPAPMGGAVGGGGSGTSPSTGGGQYQRLIESADSSSTRLTGLKPDTTYTVTLTPESNELSFNALTTTFRTNPGVFKSLYTLFTHKNAFTLLP